MAISNPVKAFAAFVLALLLAGVFAFWNGFAYGTSGPNALDSEWLSETYPNVGGANVSDEQGLRDALSAGGEYTLTKNILIEGDDCLSVPASTSVTLNMGKLKTYSEANWEGFIVLGEGSSLTMNVPGDDGFMQNADNFPFFRVKSGATLTIKGDFSLKSYEGSAIVVEEGGTFKSTGKLTFDSGGYVGTPFVDGNGDVSIENCTFDNTKQHIINGRSVSLSYTDTIKDSDYKISINASKASFSGSVESCKSWDSDLLYISSDQANVSGSFTGCTATDAAIVCINNGTADTNVSIKNCSTGINPALRFNNVSSATVNGEISANEGFGVESDKSNVALKSGARIQGNGQAGVLGIGGILDFDGCAISGNSNWAVQERGVCAASTSSSGTQIEGGILLIDYASLEATAGTIKGIDKSAIQLQDNTSLTLKPDDEGKSDIQIEAGATDLGGCLNVLSGSASVSAGTFIPNDKMTGDGSAIYLACPEAVLDGISLSGFGGKSVVRTNNCKLTLKGGTSVSGNSGTGVSAQLGSANTALNILDTASVSGNTPMDVFLDFVSDMGKDYQLEFGNPADKGMVIGIDDSYVAHNTAHLVKAGAAPLVKRLSVPKDATYMLSEWGDDLWVLSKSDINSETKPHVDPAEDKGGHEHVGASTGDSLPVWLIAVVAGIALVVCVGGFVLSRRK